MFIDYVMRHFTDHRMEYEKDSLWGKKGNVSEEIVYSYMKVHPFFTHPPRKATSRELFGDDKAIEFIKICTDAHLSLENRVATITGIMAKTNVDACYTWGLKGKEGKLDIEKVYMCDGGASNPNIWDYMQQELGSYVRMTMLDESGVRGEAKEASTFAFQAIDAVLGGPSVVPQRVETRTPTIVGKFLPGRNYRELMRNSCALWRVA